MTSDLLLVEHAYQVHDFVARGLSGDERWVALALPAAAALDELGVPYAICEESYSREDLEEVCLAGHRQLKTLCRDLDNWLGQKRPVIESRGMPPI